MDRAPGRKSGPSTLSAQLREAQLCALGGKSLSTVFRRPRLTKLLLTRFRPPIQGNVSLFFLSNPRRDVSHRFHVN